MKYFNKKRCLDFKTILEDKENADSFKHFKGKIYKIICISKDCDNLEELVVYQGQYEDSPIFSRHINEFFSEVDIEKYPEANQKFRFELMNN